MPVSVTNTFGKKRSRVVKKAAWYSVSVAVGILATCVVYTIYQVSNYLCFDCTDQFGNPVHQKMPMWYWTWGLITLIAGRAIYKYVKRTEALRAYVQAAKGVQELADIEAAGEIPFSFEKRDTEEDLPRWENYQRQVTQRENREYLELQRWAEEERRKSDEQIRNLQREIEQMKMQMARPDHSPIGFTSNQQQVSGDDPFPKGRMRRYSQEASRRRR